MLFSPPFALGSAQTAPSLDQAELSSSTVLQLRCAQPRDFSPDVNGVYLLREVLLNRTALNFGQNRFSIAQAVQVCRKIKVGAF